MSVSLNQYTCAGNLCRDVELRHIQNGTAVTDISLAINDRVKRGSEWVDEVTYVDVTVWGKQAEVLAEYARKGTGVLVSGRLTLDRWEQDGQKRSKLKVTAERVQMLGQRPTGDSSSQERPARRTEHSQQQEEEHPF